MELLTFTTAGSVDDGKSTLIGRLLHDAGALFDDQVEELRRAASARGRSEPDLALVTDGLRAEREQGITIDVAYRYFGTPRRRFVIADAPGHVQHTRNMVCGASVSDAAVVLVDATAGVTEQTRRHTFLLSLLGVPHLVFAINKMDLVAWSKTRFLEITEEVEALVGRLGRLPVHTVPISALTGANVVTLGEGAAWYEGPSLLTHLEDLEVARERDLRRVRLPVQGVVRADDGSRRYTGRLASGVLRPGDPVVVLPAGVATVVDEVHGPTGPRSEAVPPLSIAVTLADQVDVGRGDLICSRDAAPVPVREFSAVVCWMDSAAGGPGDRVLVKHGTSTVTAEIAAVESRVEIADLTLAPADSVGLNDVVRIVLRTGGALPVDDYADLRDAGRFILLDAHDRRTLAAGMVDLDGRALAGLS